MPWTSKPALEGSVQYGANPKTSWGRRGGAAARLAGPQPAWSLRPAGCRPVCRGQRTAAASGVSILPCEPERRARSCDQRAAVCWSRRRRGAHRGRPTQPSAVTDRNAVQRALRLTMRMVHSDAVTAVRRCLARRGRGASPRAPARVGQIGGRVSGEGLASPVWSSMWSTVFNRSLAGRGSKGGPQRWEVSAS